MKYIITRQFSFTNEKFEVVCNSEIIAIIKATPSKQYNGQYNLRFSNLIDECFCIVESDPNVLHSYLIYSINNQTDEKILFGRLSYEISHYDNDYTYTIIIGQKLYRVRSSDLKYCLLTIIDTNQMNGNYSETLFQLTDSFSKSNDKYHLTIHDKEWPLGYLALTILIHLHESQRNVF